ATVANKQGVAGKYCFGSIMMFQYNADTVGGMAGSIQCRQFYIAALNKLSFIEGLVRIKHVHLFAYIYGSTGSFSNLQVPAYEISVWVGFNDACNACIIGFCIIVIGLRVARRVYQKNFFCGSTQDSVAVMCQA